MWVDIANLIGPRGEPGQDGDPGPQGPINVGLRPEEQITYDPAGGFTFHFVDDTSQTVNLPIASAQSAGLLSPTDKAKIDGLASTGRRDITSLVASGPVSTGSLVVYRVGNIVTLTTRDIKIDASGWKRVLALPLGFCPPATIESSAWWTTTGGLYQCILNANGNLSLMHPGGSETIRGYFTFATEEAWPPVLPGTPV